MNGFKRLDATQFNRLIPRILQCNTALGCESYSSTPMWGLLHNLMELQGKATAGLSESFLSPDDCFVAQVYTQRLVDKYGVADNQQPTGSSFVYPLTLDMVRFRASITEHGPAVAPLHDLHENLIPVSGLPGLEAGYMKREFFFPTKALRTLKSDNDSAGLLRRRQTIRRYAKPPFRLLDYNAANALLLRDKLDRLYQDWCARFAQRDDAFFLQETRYLLSPEGAEFVGYSDLSHTGYFLLQDEQLVGVHISCSTGVKNWTRLVMIHERLPCVADYLASMEAYRWDEDSEEADGDGAEHDLSLGLFHMKDYLCQRLGGRMSKFLALAKPGTMTTEFQENLQRLAAVNVSRSRRMVL